MSFVTTDEFSVRDTKVTSRIDVSSVLYLETFGDNIPV